MSRDPKKIWYGYRLLQTAVRDALAAQTLFETEEMLGAQAVYFATQAIEKATKGYSILQEIADFKQLKQDVKHKAHKATLAHRASNSPLKGAFSSLSSPRASKSDIRRALDAVDGAFTELEKNVADNFEAATERHLVLLNHPERDEQKRAAARSALRPLIRFVEYNSTFEVASYLLGLMLSEHEEKTRYPDDDRAPHQFYDRQLPLLELFPEVIGAIVRFTDFLREAFPVDDKGQFDRNRIWLLKAVFTPPPSSGK